MIPNATLAFAFALLGWAPLAVVFTWRLNRLRADLGMVMHDAEHAARRHADLCAELDRLRDDLTDLRGEYLAQARALDDRLVRLEPPDSCQKNAAAS